MVKGDFSGNENGDFDGKSQRLARLRHSLQQEVTFSEGLLSSSWRDFTSSGAAATSSM